MKSSIYLEAEMAENQDRISAIDIANTAGEPVEVEFDIPHTEGTEPEVYYLSAVAKKNTVKTDIKLLGCFLTEEDAADALFNAMEAENENTPSESDARRDRCSFEMYGKEDRFFGNLIPVTKRQMKNGIDWWGGNEYSFIPVMDKNKGYTVKQYKDLKDGDIVYVSGELRFSEIEIKDGKPFCKDFKNWDSKIDPWEISQAYLPKDAKPVLEYFGK